ncbi:hypothetical protein EJ08DRAFT_656318 [Tothia fuscella]|uniref:Uncharacterized protein n=1 Tax=Tothia fuscella TaxID=1048955 RepID=A0A9P4NZD1_9PEZI|nr:hypothetical protein EJ08DRAFT_656318 [Tothia fuscella]
MGGQQPFRFRPHKVNEQFFNPYVRTNRRFSPYPQSRTTPRTSEADRAYTEAPANPGFRADEGMPLSLPMPTRFTRRPQVSLHVTANGRAYTKVSEQIPKEKGKVAAAPIADSTTHNQLDDLKPNELNAFFDDFFAPQTDDTHPPMPEPFPPFTNQPAQPEYPGYIPIDPFLEFINPEMLSSDPLEPFHEAHRQYLQTQPSASAARFTEYDTPPPTSPVLRAAEVTPQARLPETAAADLGFIPSTVAERFPGIEDDAGIFAVGESTNFGGATNFGEDGMGEWK